MGLYQLKQLCVTEQHAQESIKQKPVCKISIQVSVELGFQSKLQVLAVVAYVFLSQYCGMDRILLHLWYTKLGNK